MAKKKRQLRRRKANAETLNRQLTLPLKPDDLLLIELRPCSV